MTRMSGLVLAVAEHRDGVLCAASLETAAMGRRLAGITGGRVIGVVLGHPAREAADEFARESGLEVVALDHQALSVYNADAWIAALAEIVKERGPSYILIPHTATGWDYAPRLAVKVGGSCITAAVGLAEGEGVTFMRRVLGGKMEEELTPHSDRPAVVTVTPGSVEVKDADKPGEVVEERLADDVLASVGKRSRTLGRVEALRGDLDLSRAEVIVTAGRGVGAPENIGLIEELASCFDKGAVGASRPVVDAGWLPYEHQVGQTGQTVAPKLYLACGVSGQIQHVSAIAGSELIVAINSDQKAAIFAVAHLGVVKDLHEFVPALIGKIKDMK